MIGRDDKCSKLKINSEKHITNILPKILLLDSKCTYTDFILNFHEFKIDLLILMREVEDNKFYQ